MRVFSTLVMGCALFLNAGPQTALADPFKLNSGKIVDILSVAPVKTAKGRTLKLRYRSKTALSDTATLRKEADGLWEYFLVNAERGGHERVVISAMGPKKAGAGTPVDFIFVKRASGWRTLEHGLGPKGKLTEKFIRELAGRDKRLEYHRNYNADLLYLAKDWTVTYTYPRHLGIDPITIDRETLFEWNKRILDSNSNLSGQSEILRIKISSNGMAAQAEIRVDGQMNIRGRLMAFVGRYLSNVELRQGAIVYTQALMVVEDIAVAMEH